MSSPLRSLFPSNGVWKDAKCVVMSSKLRLANFDCKTCSGCGIFDIRSNERKSQRTQGPIHSHPSVLVCLIVILALPKSLTWLKGSHPDVQCRLVCTLHYHRHQCTQLVHDLYSDLQSLQTVVQRSSEGLGRCNLLNSSNKAYKLL